MGWKKDLTEGLKKIGLSKFAIDMVIHEERMMRREAREFYRKIYLNYSGTYSVDWYNDSGTLGIYW